MHRLIALLLVAHAAGAASYYVDCASGVDANSGGSPGAAWKTLAKVSATAFAPGDSILLHRGGRCAGSLWPKGSGEDGRPVRIGAYGDGPLPQIIAGESQAAVKLFDQHGWEIENLETSGGNPYGVYIGARGGGPALRHFVLRNLVVHDVVGTPRQKASGLVVVSGPLQDILIDGITAYRTSQWAGIFVSGANTRARDVVVRNSIVHDVDGDGIVIFLAENGRIERSAAWHTGLQDKETIGTPNAIWTWSCRDCVVENNEGFWIDSPGVDGGVYDIDWGNDNNIVQHNYAHDAQGYCAAAFGAGHRATTNSIIRDNVCVNNGRSPKLARRQGDLFTSTWDGGSLDGLIIQHNTVVWNPPIDAPAVQMKGTEFSGTRPNVVSGNVIYSSAAALVRSGPPVEFADNQYWHPGPAAARWNYGMREYTGAAEWKEISRSDRLVNLGLDWRLGVVSTDLPLPPRRKLPAALNRSKGNWMLLVVAGRAGAEARSQLVFVQAALAQYRDSGLDASVAADGPDNLPFDWNFGAVRAIEAGGIDRALGIQKTPALLLISPAGEIVHAWAGFAAPAELGLSLKHYLGPGPGNPPLEIERTMR